MAILKLKAKLRRTIKTDDGYLPKGSYLPAGTSAEAVERLLKANRIRLEGAQDTPPELDNMAYADLRALAKEYGIPGNQKADELRAALSEVYSGD